MRFTKLAEDAITAGNNVDVIDQLSASKRGCDYLKAVVWALLAVAAASSRLRGGGN